MGNVVLLFDNGLRRSFLSLKETGRFRFRLAGLSYGAHDFVVVAEDDLGNEARAVASVELRAPLPRLEIDGTWNPRIILTREVSLTGKALPPGVVCLRDNGVSLPATLTGASGRFSFSLTGLAHGDHRLELMTINATHEAAATAWGRVVRPLRLLTPRQGVLLNQRQTEVTGRAHPGVPVLLFVNGKQQAVTTATARGVFRFPAAQLVEGGNVIHDQTRPGRELRQDATLALTTDTIPPAVALEFPEPGTRTMSAAATAVVRAEPGASVSVSVWRNVLVTRTAPADGEMVVSNLPLRDRPLLLTVAACDAAGNTRTTSRWIWRGLLSAPD